MSDSNATLAFTVSVNEYRESDVQDITVAELSDEEISAIASLTEFSEQWLNELRKENKVPCRTCGEIITKNAHDPPVCQPCLRGENPATAGDSDE